MSVLCEIGTPAFHSFMCMVHGALCVVGNTIEKIQKHVVIFFLLAGKDRPNRLMGMNRALETLSKHPFTYRKKHLTKTALL